MGSEESLNIWNNRKRYYSSQQSKRCNRLQSSKVPVLLLLELLEAGEFFPLKPRHTRAFGNHW